MNTDKLNQNDKRITHSPSFLGQQIVPLGSDGVLDLEVGLLPSGSPLHVKVFVFRGKEEGPTALFLGGVHGDEVNGIEIVRRAITEQYFSNLKKGTVLAIPLLNVQGFIQQSREVNGHFDVNRSFPGSQSGSLAAKLAYLLSHEILPFVDFGVDFHTGGNTHFNTPQIRYSTEDERAHELAQAFGAPIVVAKKMIPKSLRKYAYQKQVPILVYEGGERLRFHKASVEIALQGIHRLLRIQEMIIGNQAAVKAKNLVRSRWIRAINAGLFHRLKSAGDEIDKGEKLGWITDPYGQQVRAINATKAGIIIGHNNASVIHQGDALFHLGYSAE